MVPVILSSGIAISTSRVPWFIEYAPGILLGFVLFGFLVAVYLVYRLLKKSRFEKELLMRAEIAGEYEKIKQEEQKEKRKKARRKSAKKSEEPIPEYIPVVEVGRHLKEDEKQIVNILKEREGKAEQGTIRVVSGMPKSSLSRILKELEERNIIYKEKRGKKNMVFLR